jgi:hypothetical protein
MALGPNDLQGVVLPSAWDGNELTRITLADGTTYAEIVQDINAAVQLFNQSIAQSELAPLMSPTSDAAIEYGQGSGNAFEDATEYAQGDAQRTQTGGHMLPLRLVDYKMGWTARWLEEARRAQIDNDINSMLDSARDIFEKRVLTRLFKLEPETGVGYGLGSAGISPGFADGGAPAGTVAFTPRPFLSRAAVFTSSHQHYMRLNGITQANLESAVKNLWEHGYDQVYDMYISIADVSSWTNTGNVTGFKARPDLLLQYGQDVTLGLVDQSYIGVITTAYGSVRLRASARIPQGYYAIFKSFGLLDPRNPIAVRFNPMRGFGLRLTVDRVDRYPLAGAIGEMAFGVGVKDRVSAVVVYNNTSGDYVSPSIS